MSLENVIESYGYWALFLGTLLEGETFVVIAGFLAHQGYLQLKLVIPALSDIIPAVEINYLTSFLPVCKLNFNPGIDVHLFVSQKEVIVDFDD